MTKIERLGAMCREARKSCGLTLRELAERIGTTPQNLCKFEHGNNHAIDLLIFYVKFCDIDLEVLKDVIKD